MATGSVLARPLVAAFAVASLTVAAPAGAQEAWADRPFARNALSVQPLGLAADVLSLEYERALRGASTLAINVTVHGDGSTRVPFVAFYEELYEGDDRRRQIVDAKLRLHPAEIPFHGLAFVLHAGSWRERLERWESGRTTHDWRTVPQVGVSVEWSQGGLTRGDYLVKLGAGARRLLAGHPDLAGDVRPMLHLSVGVLF